MHTGRNCSNLFHISFSANTADAHPGVSGVSKEQKFCEKLKNTHCQVDHPAKIELNQKPLRNSSKFLKKWQIVFDFTPFWLDGQPGNEYF